MTSAACHWPPSAVLFDMDGVLVDSAAAHNRVWTRWARLRALDPGVVCAAAQGKRRIDTLRLMAPGLPAAEEHQLLDDLMAAEEPTMRLFPGAAALLRALPERSWGVVTSSRTKTAQSRLRRLGLPVPEVLVCAENVTVSKPSPEGFLAAAAELATPADCCLVIEDSPTGIAAGIAAGCTVFTVATTHPPDQLHQAHACFPSLLAAERYVLARQFSSTKRG